MEKDRIKILGRVHKGLKAFTLAEVLITVVVIGIIAAITLPSVLISIEKHKNVTVLKRAYSDFQKYLLAYQNEYNATGKLLDYNYNSDASLRFTQSFVSYLIDKQGFKSVHYGDPWGNLKYNDNIPRGYDYWCNGSQEKISSSHGAFCIQSPNGLYVLSFFEDATMSHLPYYAARGIGKQRFILGVNLFTNPKNMAPNMYNSSMKRTVKWGRDVFRFFITNTGRVVPNGSPFCGGYSCKVLSDTNCTKDAENFTCLQKIINDGWQIKYNY